MRNLRGGRITLEFKNIRVTSTGATLLRFIGLGVNSRLLIRGSTFETCDNDILGFGAGVRIDHSVLQDPIEGAGSCDLVEKGPSEPGDSLQYLANPREYPPLFRQHDYDRKKHAPGGVWYFHWHGSPFSPAHARREERDHDRGEPLV